MDSKFGIRTLGRLSLILAGALISTMFWMLEALMHVLIFHDMSFAHAVFAPPAHEVWMRLTVVGMFMTFAVYSNQLVEALRRAENAARSAEAEVSQIFETAADGMRVVDSEFRVLRANETFAALVGLPKREILGRKCSEVFRGHLCDTPGCPLTRIMGGEQRIEYDAEKVRPDGRIVPCIVAATPFRGPDDEVLGIVEDFKDISERRMAESALLESRERLQELTSHLQVVREHERSRIAREIHDELGQALTALNMDLHWLRNRLPQERDELKEKALGMSDLIDETVKAVRRICSELRPGFLDDFGLSAAIEWQAVEFAKRTGIDCRIESDPEDIVLGDELSIAVFRIFQETLTNIARHAQATSVEVKMSATPGAFSLQVSDDGKGLSASSMHRAKTYGLIGIRERVRDFGGELEIGPAETGGTRVEVVIPTGLGVERA